jgi:hypothetical protein
MYTGIQNKISQNMYTGIQNDFKRTIIAYNNLILNQIIKHRCICSFNTSSSRYWGDTIYQNTNQKYHNILIRTEKD